MAKMGRPKVDNPINRVVTVKFREEEYQLMLEYAETHNLSISQMIRLGIDLQLKNQPKQNSAGSFLQKGEKDGL